MSDVLHLLKYEKQNNLRPLCALQEPPHQRNQFYLEYSENRKWLKTFCEQYFLQLFLFERVHFMNMYVKFLFLNEGEKNKLA